MLDVVTAAWRVWWLIFILIDAAVLWLFVMALLFGSTAGPLSSDEDLSALERLAARRARRRGNDLDHRQGVVELGPHTSALLERFGERTDRLWRSNRGVLLPARLLAGVCAFVGVTQFLFTLLAHTPRFPSVAWVFISLGVLSFNLLSGIAVLIAERRRWRRRAPFELLLTRSVMQATTWSGKEPTWPVARSSLAGLEQVLDERFRRVRDRPLSAVARDLEWTRRVEPWADRLARIDLRLGGPAERPAAVLAAQIEAAIRFIDRPAKRSRADAISETPSEKRRLDPQTRIGVMLVLFIGGVAVFFTGLGALELSLNDQYQLPSREEVEAWLSFAGPVATIVAALAGAAAWVRRRLSPGR